MDSIGQILKQNREARGLDPSAVAAGTRIKVQHIEAIERDDYSGMPALAYAKGFLKMYAEFLELDPEPLLERFRADYAADLSRNPLAPAEEQAAGAPKLAGRSGKDAARKVAGWLQQIIALFARVGRPAVVAAAILLLAVAAIAIGLKTCGRESTQAGSGPADRLDLVAPPPEPFVEDDSGPAGR